jgi:hypothetical protein
MSVERGARCSAASPSRQLRLHRAGREKPSKVLDGFASSVLGAFGSKVLGVTKRFRVLGDCASSVPGVRKAVQGARRLRLQRAGRLRLHGARRHKTLQGAGGLRLQRAGREKPFKVLGSCPSNVPGTFGSKVLGVKKRFRVLGGCAFNVPGVKSPSTCSTASPPTCWT